MSDYFYSIGMICRQACYDVVIEKGTCLQAIELSRTFYQLANEENQ